MARASYLLGCRGRNRRSKLSDQTNDEVWTSFAVRTHNGNRDRREVGARRVAAHRVREIGQRRPSVVSSDASPFGWKGIPRATAFSVAVRSAQQRIGRVAKASTQRARSDLGENHNLSERRTM